LLASLAEPSSEDRLQQLRAQLRAEETQAQQSLEETQTPFAHAGTGAGTLRPGAGLERQLRKRRWVEREEEPLLLKPRFRLQLPEESVVEPQDELKTSILSVAVTRGRPFPQGAVAVLLSSGSVELWKADPMCWHLLSAVSVPTCRCGRLSFSRRTGTFR
ncbi:unnamed protein product, partial [Durusdinium trenchii]